MDLHTQSEPKAQLERLIHFLGEDPSNTNLLADAASLAFDASAIDLSAELIARHANLQPLPSHLVNLQGLIAIAQNRYDDAATIFSGLKEQGVNNPGLRFNLAWSKAMTGGWQEALDLLDDQTMAVSYRAPLLKIQMLHHLGRLDEALDCGKILAERYPENHTLMGALASIAIDAEQSDLALAYAKSAGDNADGQAVLGILALGQQDTTGSIAIFDQALLQEPNNPRALVGKGLSLLSAGDTINAAKVIDRGAEIFRTHIGSWVASGWAHFTLHDYATSRARFEKALAIDPNFSETHGGLAALNAVEGKIEDATRECEVALRLDKNCFGAALAKSIILEQRGHPQMAQKFRNIFVEKVTAQKLAVFGGGRPQH